jgi:thiol-disulfide isomerase/thioredoxin/glycerophosphoryl diester phosphodiesterase
MTRSRILILVLFLYNCFAVVAQQNKQQQRNNVNLQLSAKEYQIKRVVLDTSQTEFGGNFMDKTLDGSNTIDFTFNLNKPKLFQITSIMPQSMSSELFITPGDTVTFYLDSKTNRLVFEGKNAAHYNYFNKLKVAIPENIWEITRGKDAVKLNYKEILETRYKKELQFLENYAKTEQVSEGFYLKMKSLHYYEYLSTLLNPNIVPKEVLDAHPEYYDEIIVSSFNDNSMLDCWAFKTCLLEYIDYDTSNDFTSENLQKKLNFIEKNLKGNVKQYAITKTLEAFNEHLSPAFAEQLKSAMQLYLKTFSVQNYKFIIEYYHRALIKRQSAQIPNAILNAKLIDLKGNAFSFNEILETNKDKIKILDFWASWCKPCVEEIKKGYPLREPLAKEKNIQFIFISTDEDSNEWKKRINSLNKYGMSENQYLMSKEDKSAMQEYFNLYSIPRFCMINRKNEMVTFLMPRPSETEEFNKWIEKADLKN